jgi:hypothetical protein
VICIKSVCDFFDIAQGKKQSVQLAGVIAIVNCDIEKSDYLFNKNSKLTRGDLFARHREFAGQNVFSL